MNVTVVGAAGYIGPMLCARLTQNGHKVTGYDFRTGFDVNHWDRGDVIIYLGGMTNNDMCERNPRLAHALNEEAFEKVIAACQGNKFIFASSVAVYGVGEGFMESDATNPTTAYGRSKKACEEMLKASDLDYTIVRSASVCGYSASMRYDLMVNRMTRDAAKTGKLTVNGGAQMRSHVHINDLCRFYATLVDMHRAQPASREIFNVVRENQSVMDTANLVARTIGKTDIEVTPYSDNRSYTVSGDKAKAAGFNCVSSIKDAIISVYLNTLYD